MLQGSLATALVLLLLGPTEGKTANLLQDPGFERGLAGWTRWGARAGEVRVDSADSRSGSASCVSPGKDGALYTHVPVNAGHAYRLHCFYRAGERSEGAQFHVDFAASGSGNGSAGSADFVVPGGDPRSWQELDRVVVAPREAVRCQLIVNGLGGPTWFDDMELSPAALPYWADPHATAWDGLARLRTPRPLFRELLGSAPGNYQATMWGHGLLTSVSPESSWAAHPAQRQAEVRTVFDQMGKSHLGALLLPWGVGGGTALSDFWKTDAFLGDLHARYGLLFDVAAEPSALASRALTLGGENLSAAVTDGNAQPEVSLLDPAYIDASVGEIAHLGDLLGQKPYVRALQGRDEPAVAVFRGLRSEAGPRMRGFDEEVRSTFGFGSFGIPAPGDPEWRKRTQDHPFCWIAFNRWMAERYVHASRARFEASRAVNPGWIYVPCDFWMMDGLIPYDVGAMSAYADMIEGDPYGSSAECTPGRGGLNPGFGAKLLSDLGYGALRHTRTPVEVVIQAFDFAGYAVQPDDLLEWSSQALRAGASSLSFYASGAPQFRDPALWQMMCHIASTVTAMPELILPDATRTAVLFCSTAHQAEGPSACADQVYTAYGFLGPRLGCWFDFIDDRQVARGERKLSDYAIIYLPLADYADPALARELESWVRKGGTLVCGDPGAFSHAPDGMETGSLREELFGVRTQERADPGRVLSGKLSIRTYPRRMRSGPVPTAHTVTLPDRPHETLATYPDGGAALVRTRLGSGATVFFAVNPFTPQSLLDDTSWSEVFRGLERAAGEEFDLPIWRFRLPSP